MARLARLNLKTFDFIGITERFEESFFHLGRKLRVQMVGTLRENANTERPNDVDPAVVQRLREFNSSDQELYEMAIAATLLSTTVRRPINAGY